jgi:hypothetical protein
VREGGGVVLNQKFDVRSLACGVIYDGYDYKAMHLQGHIIVTNHTYNYCTNLIKPQMYYSLDYRKKRI